MYIENYQADQELISALESNNISKMIMIIKEKIKKSFFDILSPPISAERRQSPNYQMFLQQIYYKLTNK